MCGYVHVAVNNLTTIATTSRWTVQSAWTCTATPSAWHAVGTDCPDLWAMFSTRGVLHALHKLKKTRVLYNEVKTINFSWCVLHVQLKKTRVLYNEVKNHNFSWCVLHVATQRNKGVIMRGLNHNRKMAYTSEVPGGRPRVLRRLHAQVCGAHQRGVRAERCRLNPRFFEKKASFLKSTVCFQTLIVKRMQQRL